MKFKTKLTIELELPDYITEEIETLGYLGKIELCKSHLSDIDDAIIKYFCIESKKLEIHGETIIEK